MAGVMEQEHIVRARVARDVKGDARRLARAVVGTDFYAVPARRLQRVRSLVHLVALASLWEGAATAPPVLPEQEPVLGAMLAYLRDAG